MSGGQGRGEGNERLDAALSACRRLLEILKRLRAPDGCPWDRKQTDKTMAPLVLEEAYEMADAVAAGKENKIAEEMGDLFMNVFMTGLIAEETGRFTLEGVFEGIAAKLIHRHPHVFGAEGRKNVEAVLTRWEDLKRSERAASREDTSAVAGVPAAMPALLRAFRVAEKLRRTRPDLPPFRRPLEEAQQALERFGRLAAERAAEVPPQARTKVDEDAGAPEGAAGEGLAGVLGDLLLSLCNAASLHNVNPEMALRAAVADEEAAFRAVERALAERLKQAERSEVDRLWRAGDAET